MKKIDNKEIVTSTAKSIFGVIPFGGAALDELFFEYNGRIKQKRLNRFVEILADNFTAEKDINIDNIKTEDFNDLFEAVIRRVVQTKSELKLLRFKDILIKELNNPTQETELIDIYLDLISSLSEEELIILLSHKDFDKSYDEERKQLDNLNERYTKVKENQRSESIIIGRSKYQDEYETVTKQINQINEKHKKLEKYRNANYYNLTEQKFIFYKQRLFSKGLILDWGIGRIGVDPFEMMSITQFGAEFIDFIKNSDT
ncbi:hypothetical protein ML462_15420 [Gramella lutea]|uniref:Uncharacterized protein n=1 Tax=Christiangramia lutea TaxID=1607951 RepID=A0A9X2ACK1_9FLAO|nr:hypothetical protein [Christiangramia lutea]MCH4824562.1 hypothetical protein [Christiangramia lutea]